jgi:hypothetical protein
VPVVLEHNLLSLLDLALGYEPPCRRQLMIRPRGGDLECGVQGRPQCTHRETLG